MFDLGSLMCSLLMYAPTLPETGSDHGPCAFLVLQIFSFSWFVNLSTEDLNKLIGT